MKMTSTPLLVGTAVAALFQTAYADCLVGDIMYQEGQSTGHIGLECVNSTSYDGSATACGPDGKLEDTEMQFTCPDSVPYCMQCGPRGWGAALCLSTPDLGNRFCPDDDDEDFLPPGTPAPAATPIPDMFDQCDNEQDIAIWTSNGGEASRPAHSNYCSREYNGGCFLDSGCIETCFQEEYGYSPQCSSCFAAIPMCSISNDCTNICFVDSLGAECQACNAPCVEELKECTGLPEVAAAPETANPTANPTPLPTPIPTPVPVETIQTSSPTSKPSPIPTIQSVATQTSLPTKQPTNSPVIPDPNTTLQPTESPTAKPTRPELVLKTTNTPTESPSALPTASPIIIVTPPVKGPPSGSASSMANSMAAFFVSAVLAVAAIA